jgi:hypothetical protein
MVDGVGTNLPLSERSVKGSLGDSGCSKPCQPTLATPSGLAPSFFSPASMLCSFHIQHTLHSCPSDPSCSPLHSTPPPPPHTHTHPPTHPHPPMLPPGEVLKPNTPHKPLPADAGEEAIARLDKLRTADGNLRTAEIRRNMQKIMQSDAAVFRTQSSLEEGCGKLDEVVESFKDIKVGGVEGGERGAVCIKVGVEGSVEGEFHPHPQVSDTWLWKTQSLISPPSCKPPPPPNTHTTHRSATASWSGKHNLPTYLLSPSCCNPPPPTHTPTHPPTHTHPPTSTPTGVRPQHGVENTFP